MKIISEGRVPVSRCSCERCGTVFEYKSEDVFLKSFPRGSSSPGPYFLYIACPLCSHKRTIDAFVATGFEGDDAGGRSASRADHERQPTKQEAEIAALQAGLAEMRAELARLGLELSRLRVQPAQPANDWPLIGAPIMCVPVAGINGLSLADCCTEMAGR